MIQLNRLRLPEERKRRTRISSTEADFAAGEDSKHEELAEAIMTSFTVLSRAVDRSALPSGWWLAGILSQFSAAIGGREVIRRSSSIRALAQVTSVPIAR